MTKGTFGGIPIVTSDVLPMYPTPGQVGRRIVRHGLADVLNWLGEEIGPAPDDALHAVMVDGTLHASPHMVATIRGRV